MRLMNKSKVATLWQYLTRSKWRIAVIALCVVYLLDSQPRQAAALMRKHQKLWSQRAAGKLYNYFAAGTGMRAVQQDPNRKVGNPNKLIPPFPNIPLTKLNGGDTQALATPICALPFNDSGTTVGATDDYKLPPDTLAPTLTATCATIANGAGPAGSLPRGAVYSGTGTGPDVVYKMEFPSGNPDTLTITADPTGSEDLALIVYCNTVSNNLADGLVVDDTGIGGVAESVTVGNIAAGTTLYIVVDGYSTGGTPPGPSGAYTLSVTSSGTTQPGGCGPVAPTMHKAFGAPTMQTGGSAAVNLTLNNPNATPLTNASFTDTLAGGLSAVGGAVTGTCVGTTPAMLTAGATNLSFSGITIPATGNCTVSFNVTSNSIGTKTNSTSGITTTETPTAGAVSNPASIEVYGAPTIAKAFNPMMITAGGTSVVTATITNPNPLGIVAAFSDTLTNLVTAGGAVSGSCALLAPINLPAGATNVNISGVALPSNGSCMVQFAVRGNVVGAQTNATSGVTTNVTPTAGAASNTATLTVNAPTTTTIAKSFMPDSIVSGGTSTVELTLTNTLPFGVLGAFSDTLTNMTAVGGGTSGTCASLATVTIPANATMVNFTGIVIPASGAPCTVRFPVTSSTVGTHPNTTSGVTTDVSSVPSAPSNTANLTVTSSLPASLLTKAVRNDFDGDGKSDFGEFNRAAGAWIIKSSLDGAERRFLLIAPEDKDEYVPVAADFDGDFKTDVAVWRARDGRWLIQLSTTGEWRKEQFGEAGDLPLAADFDGDGQADLASWRSAENRLYIQHSGAQNEGIIELGAAGDVPVVGDYNGDGRADLAVYNARTGSWQKHDTASGKVSTEQFGEAGGTPFAADFDGDGRADLGVVDAAGTATIRPSREQGVQQMEWGSLQPGDAILLGDYDGDGREDAAILRATKGRWEIRSNR